MTCGILLNEYLRSFYTIVVTSVADPDPDLWIRICIIKVGSGSVWRDTNPDPDPGHIR